MSPMTMSERIDAARERRFRAIFMDWGPQEASELTRLMVKFAASMRRGGDSLADETGVGRSG